MTNKPIAGFNDCHMVDVMPLYNLFHIWQQSLGVECMNIILPRCI